MPIGRPPDASALATVVNGQTVDSVEKQVELADGSIGNLSVSTAKMTDSQGNPAGAVEVFQDLTKMRQMEQEIARLTTLAALGEMAATIAHQVRNPLAGIGGFASLLGRDLDDADPRQKLVTKIKRGVESLNDTVTALLNYSRSDELNLVAMDYHEFITATIDDFRMAVGSELKGFRIRVMPAGPSGMRPVSVSIDRQLMRQVFMNLLDNSFDVLKGEGNVSISYRVLPRQAAVRQYSDRVIFGVDETVLETVVADDGPGILAEHADQIFAPFFSTKQNGHGLGLAAALKIMKAHSGDILIDKNVTTGVAFKLLLPVKIDSANMERNA
jgi:signal transduction histidine kinase